MEGAQEQEKKNADEYTRGRVLPTTKRRFVGVLLPVVTET